MTSIHSLWPGGMRQWAFSGRVQDVMLQRISVREVKSRGEILLQFWVHFGSHFHIILKRQLLQLYHSHWPGVSCWLQKEKLNHSHSFPLSSMPIFTLDSQTIYRDRQGPAWDLFELFLAWIIPIEKENRGSMIWIRYTHAFCILVDVGNHKFWDLFRTSTIDPHNLDQSKHLVMQKS